MMRRWSSAATAAVIVVGAVACGGGSQGASREDFARQVNALCAQRQERIDELEGGIADEESTRQVIQLDEELLRRAREIDVPSADKAAIDQLWSLVDDQVQTLQVHADALAEGEPSDEASVVDELDAQAARFDRTASELGLDQCTAGGGDRTEDTGADATTEAAEVSLDDAARVLVDYIDAYWGGDSAAELKVSGAWAAAQAGFHATADLSPSGASAPEAAHLDMDLTSIDEVAGGYAVEGTIRVTTADATMDYTDLRLIDDPTNGLVVADYCRTSPGGYGPLEGCLSDAVGNVDGDLTSDDGSFHLAMGPMVRSLGLGGQYVDFSLCIDALTTSVTVQGGLNATFKVGSDINSLNGPGVVLSPAALGQRSCGYLEMALPASATSTTFPSGVLSFRIQRGDGSTSDIEVRTPALPQSAAEL